MTTSSPRSLRADAQRNHDALVSAGREVFASQGVDAPFDDVARRAGVGRATLYRHFPTREHLFAVLLRDELDTLREQARQATSEGGRFEQVADWLRLYHRTGRDFRGMSSHLAAHEDPDSPMATACGPMRTAFADLLTLAQRAGDIRSDVTADDVLALVSSLPGTSADKRGSTYLDVVLDGLRQGWSRHALADDAPASTAP